MTTFYKDFDSLSVNDLQQLIDDQTIEGQQLDYKTKVIDGDPLKESVAAFANASGGDLLMGITEGKKGELNQMTGVKLEDPDQTIRSITSQLLDGLDPGLRQIRVKCIPIQDNRYVVVVRAFRSWNAPHMVKGSGKLVKRTNSQNTPFSAEEVRRMINGRYDFIQLYDRFREKRIQKAKDTYQVRPPFILIHYVPLSAFGAEDSFPVVEKMQKLDHSVLGSTTAISYPNAEGTIARDPIAYTPYQEKGHTQFFKNGIIEQVSSYQFMYNQRAHRDNDGALSDDDFIIFHTIAFEDRLKMALERQWKNYKELHMNEPFYIFFQLVEAQGVIGYPLGPSLVTNRPLEIDTPLLKGPKLFIEECTEGSRIEVVDKIMNFLWNTFGFSEPQPYPKTNDITDYYYENNRGG